MQNPNTLNQNIDLELELRASPNIDFEQEFLNYDLKELHSFKASQTKSEQTLRQELQSPKSPTKNSFAALVNSEKTISTKQNTKHTGSSIMQFFFIRRFLEKLNFQRKRLEMLNNKHLDLIDDKASDSQILLAYKQTRVQKGLTFHQLQKLVPNTIQIKENKYQKYKDTFNDLRNFLIRQITQIFSKIPLVQPESKIKICWDFFASIFRIIIVILIPLEISFQPQVLFNQCLWLTIIIIIIIQIDFFIRINTLYYHNGKVIRDRLKIITHQLKKSWITDISIIVLLLLFIFNYDQYNNISWILLIILTQFKYIIESSEKSDQFSYFTRPQRGILDLIKFLASLLYFLHIFSCIWFWFSKLNENNNSWIQIKHLQDQTWELQYLESFYFAIVTMLTIGYGDNVPQNSTEKIIDIIFIIGACLWFSYSINFIGGIINDITQNQVERRQKMRVINKYMEQRQIPYSLQHQIKEYLNYRWKEDDEIDLQVEQSLLEQLSDELKDELDKQAYKVFIEKSEFLQKHFTQEFRNALFKSIKRKIVEPQHTFSIEMNGQCHLCFIEQGVLLYQHKIRKQRCKITSTIEQGQFFCVKEFLMSNPQIELFKAAGYVSLLILSKQDFVETVKEFPQDFQSYCQLRDTITLSKEPYIMEGGRFCPACNKFDHAFKNCYQIQVKQNPEVVTKRFIFQNIQNRQKFKRKTFEKPILTLAELEYVQECVNYFQFENQNLINDQLKFQLTYDPDYELSGKTDSQHSLHQRPSISIGKQVGSLSEMPFVFNNNNNNNNNNKSTIPIIKTMDEFDDKIQQQQQQQQKNLQQNIMKSSHNPKKLLRKNTRMPSIIYKQINEDEAEDSFIIDNTQKRQIEEFNKIMHENINQIHQKILQLNCDQNERLKIIQQDIQFLYWKSNFKELPYFEVAFNFDHYFINDNITKVIEIYNQGISDWQETILKRFSKYMFYPFQFVLKFLKLRRTTMKKTILSAVKKFQRTKKKLWLFQLRNNLNSSRKIGSIQKIKVNSIKPAESDKSIKLIKM